MDGIDPLATNHTPRRRDQESLSIRMTGRFNHTAGGSCFDKPSSIHHRDPVGNFSSSPDIMGDETDSHPEFILHFPEAQ